MTNKIIGLLFFIIFLACVLFGILKHESFSPLFMIFLPIFALTTAGLSLFFLIRKSTTAGFGPAATGQIQSQKSWFDAVPAVCFVLGILIFFVNNRASQIEELSGLAHFSMFALLIDMIIALVFCVIIAADHRKSTIFRIGNAICTFVLLAFICILGLMIPWLLACQPGAGSC